MIHTFLWNYVTEPIQPQACSNETNELFRFTKATVILPTLCLRDLELDSNNTSHCKKGYAPKWKESRSLHASLIQGRNKLTC